MRTDFFEGEKYHFWAPKNESKTPPNKSSSGSSSASNNNNIKLKLNILVLFSLLTLTLNFNLGSKKIRFTLEPCSLNAACLTEPDQTATLPSLSLACPPHQLD